MLPKLTVRQKLSLLEHFSDPEEIYYAQDYGAFALDIAQALEDKDMTEAERVARLCADRHIGILPYDDPGYPPLLRNIFDPPLVLYYKGTLPNFEERPIISVVGTRKATAYGSNTALRISRQIAACGGLVVSGGAYGVDTMALQGAIDVGAQSVAVLGCGVDVVYPRSNSRLFAKIAANGCLLSEYVPGTEPKPWHFPERNRIISGMAQAVLVVEAPEKSGALITARDAMEQGRDVFVVPGNIDVATCAGSNALLQDGASAAMSGWDMVKEYAYQFPETVERREPELKNAFFTQRPKQQVHVAQAVQTPASPAFTDKKAIDKEKTSAYSVLDNKENQLSQEEQQVVACLTTAPKPVDEVIEEAGLPAARVLSILTMLALKGTVQNHPGRLVSVIK